MGQSSWDSPPTHISTMKMFVVLAFAAAAAAEPEANADPQYLTYGAGAYLPYTTYGAYPYSTYSAYTPYRAFPYNTYTFSYSNIAPVVNSAVGPVTSYNSVVS